jgi:hypothetical protein
MELECGVSARTPLLLLVVLLIAACGSAAGQSPAGTPTASPATSAPATPMPALTPSPSPAPSLDVTPLIPDLTSDGTLDMLHEDGTTATSFPASTSLELFSPLGNDFLAGRQTNSQISSLVSIAQDGSLSTLQPIASPATFAGAVGALDGHAWAWLQGTRYSSQCNQGLSSGALEVGSPGTPAHAIAQLPSGGATAAWSLGGWVGDDIWLVRTAGCPAAGTATTTAYVAHETGGPLTSVQAALGNGCALDAVALDGSMLCATQPAKSADTTWRFVSASGATQSFSATSLPGLCAGHGTLQDFEGLALSLDAATISIDAGCNGTSRFDELFLIATATGTVRPVSSPTYLAADSWLPDGALLCTDLSSAMAPQSYLVTSTGAVSAFASGEAVWSTTDVLW